LGYAWSYMAGDIAEVLVYNTVLSDTDRQGVENYLNGKYAVLSAPPAPVISPPGGTYPGSVTVTLSTPALGTQLYYTTDGSQPTTNSTLYAVPFNLSSNATVTAVSYLNGMASATTNADFAVTAGSAPTAAAGLAFWFRADVGVITDGSGNVSQWLDESDQRRAGGALQWDQRLPEFSGGEYDELHSLHRVSNDGASGVGGAAGEPGGRTLWI
jgi:hypothetical protein